MHFKQGLKTCIVDLCDLWSLTRRDQIPNPIQRFICEVGSAHNKATYLHCLCIHKNNMKPRTNSMYDNHTFWGMLWCIVLVSSMPTVGS